MVAKEVGGRNSILTICLGNHNKGSISVVLSIETIPMMIDVNGCHKNKTNYTDLFRSFTTVKKEFKVTNYIKKVN